MTENQKGGVDIREYVKMYTSEDAVPETNGTTSSELTGIQVKFEVEDPEYEQGMESSTVSAGLLRSFQAPQVITSSQSAAEWTGTSSAIRTELRKMMEDKSLDSSTATQNVQTVIENLLKKNENLLAQNDAMGYKPYSRRGRPALEGSRGKDSVFPGSGQSVTFSAGTQTQGRITGIGTRQYSQLDNATATAQLGQLMRPKSPTRRCAVQERDKSHFNLALMESKVGCKEGEQIFKVQEHEMVCAISSQTKFLNKEGRLVSSVDISYYWCNFCNYSTTNKTFLMQHVMEHRFHCKHCRYQSFSRADVIHHSVHTHPGFQDTASITQYCTLLPDYLRVHNPSEAQLDQRRKRKDPPPDDGDEPSAKVSKNKVDKNMVQKSYLADYDLFNVSVEELKEKAEEEGGSAISVETGSKTSSASSSGTVLSSPADPGSQTSSMVSSLVSQPASAVAQSSVSSVSQPVITQVFSASTLPPTLAPAMAASGTSQASPHASSSSPTPATPFYPNSMGAGAMQQMRSNLYWSCGYCSFTSTTQSGIKEHSVMQHSGKPHRYVALIKSEGGESTPPPTGNCTGEQASESEVTLETDKSPEPLATETDDKEELDEPPVLVKLEPVDQEDTSVPIRVRFPTPRIQPKDPTTLKCIHCNHTSRSLGPLRNHILNRHKGKCLVGVGGVSSRVFMCSRADCTFRSSSGQTFLSHSRECTPWLVSDEPVANHLKKCLEATTRIAEEAEAALSSPATVSGPSAIPSSQIQPDQVPVVEEGKTDDEVRMDANHFLFPLPPTPNKETPTKLCRVCTKKLRKRKETRYHCPSCPSKPGLCLGQCFKDYHTKIQPDQEEGKTDDEVRMDANHFLFPLPPTPNKEAPTKKCRVCSKKLNVRKESRYHCPSCPSKPGLCLGQCFMDYHTKIRPDQVPVVEEGKTDDEVRMDANHFLFPLPPTPNKEAPTKKCRVCYKILNVRKESRYHCPFCPSKPGLCLGQCFMDYHTKIWPDQVPVDEEGKTDDEVRMDGNHFLFPLPPTPNKETPTKPCRVCTKKLKKRKETRYHCPSCPSKPGLCLGQCFKEYHTKAVYWK